MCTSWQRWLWAYLLSMRRNKRSLSPMMKNERKSYFLPTGVRTPVNASSPEAFGTRSTWRRQARARGESQHLPKKRATPSREPTISVLMEVSGPSVIRVRRAHACRSTKKETTETTKRGDRTHAPPKYSGRPPTRSVRYGSKSQFLTFGQRWAYDDDLLQSIFLIFLISCFFLDSSWIQYCLFCCFPCGLDVCCCYIRHCRDETVSTTINSHYTTRPWENHTLSTRRLRLSTKKQWSDFVSYVWSCSALFLELGRFYILSPRSDWALLLTHFFLFLGDRWD